MKDYLFYIETDKNCPATSGLGTGTVDDKNCNLGPAPNTGFVWRNRWFERNYDACSVRFDGSSCVFGEAPAGTKAFQTNNNWYYTPILDCPNLVGFNVQPDGYNCNVGKVPKGGFVWQDRWFDGDFDACSSGRFDGSSCVFGEAPTGTKAFQTNNNWYYTPVPNCPSISGFNVQFDGQNCYLGPVPNTGFVWTDRWFERNYDACSIGHFDGSSCVFGEAPAGTKAFQSNNKWYFTPLNNNNCPGIPGFNVQFDGKNCYVGPIKKGGFVWQGRWFDGDFDACSSGRNDGSSCVLGEAPVGTKAFQSNNKWYYTPILTCPSIPGFNVQFDGKNCFVGQVKKGGFVWQDRWFDGDFDACSSGRFDGSSCVFGEAPAGTKAIQTNNTWYYTPVKASCQSIPGFNVQFDGTNCFVGPAKAGGFVWKDRWFDGGFDTCSTGRNDGSSCVLGEAPAGTRAFMSNGNFYYTAIQSCSDGKQDSTGCFLGSAPREHVALIRNNKFYYTSLMCGQAGRSCCPGDACDNEANGNRVACFKPEKVCTACGSENQYCCPGQSCDQGLVCTTLIHCAKPPCSNNNQLQTFDFCMTQGDNLHRTIEITACTYDDAKKSAQLNCNGECILTDGACK